jgi:NAD(P)-dependent dehydrogenase (short-subunit alcohol dehydrogenase family)
MDVKNVKTGAMKKVVITGVTKGLGRAMAEFFISKNITVLGCGRNLRELNAMGDQFRSPHSFTRVDVRDDASVRRWADYCLSQGPAPDMLINNAALIARDAPLWELAPNDVNPVVEVNVLGVINVIRHFLPAMIKRGSGIVVNLSSGWGRSTSPGVATYCATKWAMEGLTAALAQELPSGLAAVALNPGIIDTEMLRSCFGESAGTYPGPQEWIKSAGPFLLQLGTKDNGQSLTVPGAATS